jgi:hypothetical protein
MTTEEWIGLYKLARLGIFAIAIACITAWVFAGKRKERLEAPARRMLEDDDA